MDRIRQAISDEGGPAVVAGRLGISVQRLCNWIDRGVPVDHAAAFEESVRGTVRRWELRPDDWYRIWPELIGAPGAPPIPAPEAADPPKEAA